MAETQTKEINGHNYEASPLPARRALRLQMRLVKSLGPGLGQMLGAVKGSLSDSEIDGDALGNGVAKLMSELGSPDEAAQLLVDMVTSCVRRDGSELTPKTFNVHFQGSLLEAYKVAGFVLEVNYGDFFGEAGIGGLGEMIKEKIASLPSASPPASTQA
jgi:hypothetical protein